MRDKRQMFASVPAESPPGDTGRSWRAAILAALPYLLFAVLMGFDRLPAGFVRIALPGLLLGSFLLAWRRRWPLWSGSWAGYWLLAPLMVTSLLPADPGLPLEVVYLAVVLGPVVLLFQHRPVYGLLAVSPSLLLTTHLFAFEFVAGGNWIWVGTWLLLAVVAGAIVRRGSFPTAILLLVGLHLVVGLAFALAHALLPFRFPEMGARRPIELAAVINDFAPTTLALVAGLLALSLLHPLRRLAVRLGPRGQRRRRLLLAGMVLTLAGIFALRRQPSMSAAPSAGAVFLTVVIVLGLALSLLAALLLVRSLWPLAPGVWRDLLLPLLAACAPLVVFAQAPPLAPGGRYSASVQAQVLASYAGIVLWSLLALFVLLDSRRPSPRRDKP